MGGRRSVVRWSSWVDLDADVTDASIAAMNGLLQKLNETVVTRRSSSSGSAIASTFGSVFSTTASSAAATVAATPGAPSVIYPSSVRPIPFTVPTFPSTSSLQPPGRSPHHGAAEKTGGGRPRRTGLTDYADVDNHGRADLYANYRGKKQPYIVSHTIRYDTILCI